MKLTFFFKGLTHSRQELVSVLGSKAYVIGPK